MFVGYDLATTPAEGDTPRGNVSPSAGVVGGGEVSGRRSPELPQPPPRHHRDHGAGDGPEAPPPPPPDPPPEPPNGAQPGIRPDQSHVRIASWNILDGRRHRLASALKSIGEMNVDVGFLLETKFADGIYPKSCEGYEVFATSTTRRNQ